MGCEDSIRSHLDEDIDQVSSESVCSVGLTLVLFLSLVMFSFLFVTGLRDIILLGLVSCSASTRMALLPGSSARMLNRLEMGTLIGGLSRLLLRVVCGVSVEVLFVVVGCMTDRSAASQASRF